MKLYIDEVTVSDLLLILIMLPKLLLDAVKEELFWWRKLYPYEISTPLDFDGEHRRKCLAESLKRQLKR